MGRWAQAGRRGRAAEATPTLVLRAEPPDLVWVWSGADPALWTVESSADGGEPWDPYGSVPGGDRSAYYGGDPGFWRVGAVDGGGHTFAYSNVVETV